MCDKSQKRVIFTELSNKNININKRTITFEIIKGKEKTLQISYEKENDKTDLVLLKDNKNKNDILELRRKDDFLDTFENQEPKLHFKSSNKTKEIEREETQLTKTGKLEMYLIKDQSEVLKLNGLSVFNRRFSELATRRSSDAIKHKKNLKLNSSL